MVLPDLEGGLSMANLFLPKAKITGSSQSQNSALVPQIQ